MWCVQGWCELSFRGKRKKNLRDQQYKQKHHLMMKAIKTFLMWIVSNYIKKWKTNYIQTLPAQIQQKILEKDFITNKFTQCKNITHLKKLMYSKYQVIKILDNYFKNMKYFTWIELILFLIHSKYCRYQYAIPTASLFTLPYSSNFTLANWNPSSAQSSSYSLSFS